jgi:glycosyltransferase involved in cell wall biosynthesis
MKFSIVIPTWEQHGFGLSFLTHLLESISFQTLKDFEIIISDHSVSDEIKNLVFSFSNLNIVYVKNESLRGNSPANLNNGLKLAKGEIIKIMFQDDFFVNNNSLEMIKDYFENNSCYWLVNGCCHTTDGINLDKHMIPSWNDKIIEGVNTISSPSVLSFKNNEISFFDENLTMLMDCDYYYTLFKKHGLPGILPENLIANRIHNHQISSMYTKNINEEINLVKNKNYEFRK